MKSKLFIKLAVFSIIMNFTSCSTLYFTYKDDFKYPEWIYKQYNFCKESEVSKENNNDVVIWISSGSLNPWGWSKWSSDSIDLIVNKDIDIEKLFIHELSLEDEDGKIVIVKNKNIKRINYMFKTAKQYISTRETFNEKEKIKMTIKLVYSINDGDVITQTDKVEVWK